MRIVLMEQHDLTLKQGPSLSSVLASRLEEEILSGRLEIGARLPTELQLVETYGVSRTVVREAVAALRAAGLVNTHQGRGAFVAATKLRQSFDITPDELQSLEDVLKVLQLRTALEVEAAGIAAASRSESSLAAIMGRAEDFDRAVEADENAIEADLDFHLAIAAATGNPYFPRLLSSFGSALVPRHRVRADLQDPDRQRAYLLELKDEHHAIASAIAAGDRARARRSMKRHLRDSRYRLMRDETISSIKS